MNSTESSLLEVVKQVTALLDSIIRGRCVAKEQLHNAGVQLLARSFDAKMETVDLTTHGTKLHNMLRSPRFAQQEGSHAFSAIRAAAANLINQRSDGSKIESTQSLLVALRTSAKSSLELRRAPDMQNSALRVVEYIEKLWAAAEKSEFGLTSFSEKEKHECEMLVLDALLLKSDILAESGQHSAAISALSSDIISTLTSRLPQSGVSLATKAFKYGQAVLIKRENGAEDRVAKASAASVCYRAALRFLDGVDGNRSNHSGGAAMKNALLRDVSDLRGKCLIQHALALHLCGQHDDALRCLDQVSSRERRRDSQDLRFGVLLAIGRHVELHQCIDDLIEGLVDRERTTGAQGSKDSAVLTNSASVGIGVGEKSEHERVLGWLRRASVATRFDQPTLRHYQKLQDAWSDDVRHLEVKIQLLTGLFAQGVCPSSPPEARLPTDVHTQSTSGTPLTRLGLELCDELIGQHMQRQRMLSSKHWNQVEAVLAQALNAAHASGDWSIAVAISDRFLAALDAPSGLSSSDLCSVGSDHQKARRSQLLVLRTQALLGLNQLSEAACSADQAMTTCPSADAFVLQIQCACKSANPIEKGVVALRQLETYSISNSGNKMPRFRHQPGSILDTLEQGVAAVQSAREAVSSNDCQIYTGHPDFDPGTSYRASATLELDELELRVIISFLRAYQACADAKHPPGMVSANPSAYNVETPSFIAFMLRAYTLVSPPDTHEGTTSALSLAAAYGPTANSNGDGPNGHPRELLSSGAMLDVVPQLISSARFLLLQVGSGIGFSDEMIIASTDKSGSPVSTIEALAGPLGSTSEARALSIASWNVAQALRGRGLHSCYDESDVNLNKRHDRSASIMEPDSSSKNENKMPLTTELFLIAHEVQLAAERSQSRHDSRSDPATFTSEQLQDNVNRVGMLFLAAADLLDRVLFGATCASSDISNNGGASGGGEWRSAPATRALVEKALGWICAAQDTATLITKAETEKSLSDTAAANIKVNNISASMDLDEVSTNDRRDNSCPETQSQAELMLALKGMQVSLSVLRLMAGLQGYLSSAPPDTKETTITTAATEEKALLSLLNECQTELAMVPADKLSAAASAAKHRHHNAVAHRLLSIAISQMEAQGRGLGINNNGLYENDGKSMAADGCITEKETLCRLYCELFHASPTTDTCLEVAGNILHLLNGAAQAREASGFDEENLELIASQCYNWGLLGLSLGSADAGAMSEKLVGTAQSFLPFCAGLQQHADSIAKAYEIALEVKQQEQEDLIRYTSKMSESCA